MEVLSFVLLIIISLVVGAIVGAIVIYLFLHGEGKRYQDRIEKLIQDYESKIQNLNEQHQTEIKNARKESVDQSRSTLKGKMAEQMAPLLPGFTYLPADARFIGDPVDYVVFNGYTGIRDEKEKAEILEVVILDIKYGKASLSSSQNAIAKAIEAGKVRFEMVRVLEDGTIKSRVWQLRPIAKDGITPQQENTVLFDSGEGDGKNGHLVEESAQIHAKYP
jgi:predicted Holliday junction resolvase-like endonuclease